LCNERDEEKVRGMMVGWTNENGKEIFRGEGRR
jgi:hypothetical protein